jgi:hypothetical protein
VRESFRLSFIVVSKMPKVYYWTCGMKGTGCSGLDRSDVDIMAVVAFSLHSC